MNTISEKHKENISETGNNKTNNINTYKIDYRHNPDQNTIYTSTPERNARASQRRLRAASLLKQQFIKLDVLNSPVSEFCIPEEVLKLRQKYTNLKDVLLDKLDPTNRGKNALLLIKYHIFKPEETGFTCKLAFSAPDISLDLIYHCLPDKEFLKSHPEYVDELHEIALHSRYTTKEILSFLSNREKVINCPERDVFFYSQYLHEMKMAGALDNESLCDFVNRVRLSHKEYNFLRAKFPPMIRNHLSPGLPGLKTLFIEGLLDEKDYTGALIFLKWNIAQPNYYDHPFPNFCFGPCHRIMKTKSEALKVLNEQEFIDLIKLTFPTKEYLEKNRKNFDKFISEFSIDCITNENHLSKEGVKEIFRFISEERTIDLKYVNSICKNQKLHDFLKTSNLV